MEAGALRELPPGEARVLADLAKPGPEGLLGALGVIGHTINCRMSRGLVVAVRDG